MRDDSNGEIVERFWAALIENDFDSAGSYLHDDLEEVYPQSGEVIRRRENWLRLVRAFPGFPSIEHRRTIGSRVVWISELEFDYGGEIAGQKWQVVNVFEMRDGKLWRIHAFFGQPFEPADWRAPFVDLM